MKKVPTYRLFLARLTSVLFPTQFFAKGTDVTGVGTLATSKSASTPVTSVLLENRTATPATPQLKHIGLINSQLPSRAQPTPATPQSKHIGLINSQLQPRAQPTPATPQPKHIGLINSQLPSRAQPTRAQRARAARARGQLQPRHRRRYLH